MDLQAITRSIDEATALAKAGNVEITTQLTAIKTQAQKADARILDLEQRAADTARSSRGGTPPSAFAFGRTIASDPKIDLLRKGDVPSARINVPGSLSAICKNVLVEQGTSGTSPEYSFPTSTQFITPTPLSAPGRRLQVLQALPHLPVSAGSATLPQISSTSDGSAVQEYQGSAKGESSLIVDPQILKMATVATFLNASRQLLDDVVTLPAFLQTWLTYFCLRRYETLICTGDGTIADGTILGLSNAGTAATTNATKNADKIGQAIYEVLPSYGYSGDLVIMNSTDYFNVISERATTDQYVAGGWSAPNSNLWGVKTVSTPALSTGTAIVLDTQLVSILDRQEISFFIGTTGSQFTENIFTYLAELRGQLAIGDRHAVAVVTLS